MFFPLSVCQLILVSSPDPLHYAPSEIGEKMEGEWAYYLGDNLLSNHGNQTWILPINHGIVDIMSWHVYQGIHYHYNQNDP